jgi:O-antigen ligase
MSKNFEYFINNTTAIDKFLITIVFFTPFLLLTSIFLSDFFVSIFGLITIYLFFSKDNRIIFSQIKKYLLYFSIFYLIIILSLFFSISFENSFLASFFYFRYFLLSIGIYYLIVKYNFFINIIFYSLFFNFILLVFDCIIQFVFGFNLFGYPPLSDPTPILTSFFNDEKKLGSYVVRLFPFFLAIIYYLKLNKYNLYLFIIVFVIVFLASERVALFLFLLILFFSILILKNKTNFTIIVISTVLLLFFVDESRFNKYSTYTLKQIGILDATWNQSSGLLRYFSKEHEDLALTALIISKDKMLTGNGVKNFHLACNLLKINQKKNNINYLSIYQRNNELACSTHPHNTYLQILSEIGLFGFLFILSFFIKIFFSNIKILFKGNFNNISIAYYYTNLGIIINLFPFIPSGSFFNNWISLMGFYPLGLWLYLNLLYKKIN